ncbi:TetR/AcrR family transcriptional regulator [Nonomuraea lactucae]|uniref:TetR/AcrR family transcriptional regulator n=1 Tax=Nonomuraea lactucae TaxID=2249762 RepID=UPI000DE54126|nr:TetR/AcrR family transcriptional regulator [Nonomuraea lactucae]
MVVFAGQGDARRSMALLWRTAGATDGRPGPKPALTVGMIVDAAIAVADEQGMAALSMRAVGERLGRTAMALYTYVPGKGELLDLMYDQAYAELPARYDLEEGWRAAVTSWAEDACELYLRHPWMLQVSQARPVLGPNEYAVLDTLLRLLRATGLGRDALRGVVGTLFHFVRGAAATIAESREAESATGVGDEEWWLDRAGLLKEVAPDFADRFPAVAWLESEPSPRPADATGPYLEYAARRMFRAGLGLVLDGVETAT